MAFVGPTRNTPNPSSALVSDVAADQIRPCDFRSSTQFGQESMQALSGIHRNFAHNFSEAFGGYVGHSFEVSLKSTEQRSLSGFIEDLPKSAYLCSLRLQSRYGNAILHIDLPLLLCFLDLLMGGAGTPKFEERELTELEEQILHQVLKMFCDELQAAWREFGIELQPGSRQSLSQVQRLIRPEETVLAFTYLAKLPDSEGTLQLLLPATCSSVLLKGPAGEMAPSTPPGKSGINQRLKDRLLNCEFLVELELLRAKVLAGSLLNLQPGMILNLQFPVDAPASLMVGERPTFTAFPVRSMSRRAAHVGNRIRQVVTDDTDERTTA